MRIVFFLLIFSLNIFPTEGATYFESAISPWGVDQDLCWKKREQAQLRSAPMQRELCVSMIHFFQQYISPIDGPRSHFYPTSSQYALEAIQKYGACKGIALGCDRLLRENREAWIYPTRNMHGIQRKLDPVR